VMKRVFAWLEPFALAMWSGEIQEFAGSSAADFRWTKRTRFIGLYQTVIAERSDQNEVWPNLSALADCGSYG
jgi:hypothetical protein